MKLLALALALTGFAPAAAPPKPVNYSGTWSLDKARSTGLPSYHDRVRRHELRLVADGQTLTIHRVDDTPRGKIDATMLSTRSGS